jgi:hypothetical protein
MCIIYWQICRMVENMNVLNENIVFRMQEGNIKTCREYVHWKN